MPLGGKGPATIAVLCVQAVISGICVGGRYFTRRILKNNPGSDDLVLLASWVSDIILQHPPVSRETNYSTSNPQLFMVAFAVLFTISSIYGFGQHVNDLSPEDIKMATFIELCGQFVVSLAMGLSKTGVALFLMRIIASKW